MYYFRFRCYDRFDLDSGMRDNFYDIGRLILKTGSIATTGRLLVNFDFLSHGVVITLM